MTVAWFITNKKILAGLYFVGVSIIFADIIVSFSTSIGRSLANNYRVFHQYTDFILFNSVIYNQIYLKWL